MIVLIANSYLGYLISIEGIVLFKIDATLIVIQNSTFDWRLGVIELILMLF